MVTNTIKEKEQKLSFNRLEISSPNSSKEFEEYYRLRWEILRKPWEKPVGSEKDELEDSSFHFMVKDNKHIVGVCRLQSNNPLEAQIRFMAVDESHQGKGIGSILLKACEEKANILGCKKIILHIRRSNQATMRQILFRHLGHSP